jgi:hypothetical protein
VYLDTAVPPFAVARNETCNREGSLYELAIGMGSDVGRIASLLDAGNFFAQMLQVNSSDSMGAACLLAITARDIFFELKALRERYKNIFPAGGFARLCGFIDSWSNHFTARTLVPGQELEKVRFTLTALRVLQRPTGKALERDDYDAFSYELEKALQDAKVRKIWPRRGTRK